MRKWILTTAASSAMAAALSFLPVGGAQAMTPGTASGVRAAAAETSPVESVACWRRHGRVVCRGGPAYYSGGYYPGYYGGYGPGVGVYGPGFGVGIGVGPRWGW
jgi:hypothetical protein